LSSGPTARWHTRAARARHLAGLRVEASELLAFYASVATYQAGLLERWLPVVERPPASTLRAAIDASLPISAVGDALAWLERDAPDGIRRALPAIRRMDAAGWRAQLDTLLSGVVEEETPEAAAAFVLEMLVQPLAEHLSEGFVPASGGHAARCPFCVGAPVAGILREEGQGARRYLLCGVCLSEWGFGRVGCAACGERAFDALPVFTAEEAPGVRIDGCDTCRRYLKTFDLSTDGLQVPLADDLATVTLDLWAREQGYGRIRRHLLRI
jgi:formate dehydrogenase accessory protein FdhE